jgi:hypothetical protein
VITGNSARPFSVSANSWYGLPSLAALGYWWAATRH